MGALKDAIKKECRKKGLTQVQLAEKLGMRAGNLNNQINRDETVQLSLIKNICEALEISVGFLLNEADDFTNDYQHRKVEEEFEMVYEQLKVILNEADEAVIEQILGKIGREYLALTQKKDSSRSRAVNGD